MTRITALLDDFKLNQQIEGRKPKYIDVCSWRLSRWNEFMQSEFSIEKLEESSIRRILSRAIIGSLEKLPKPSLPSLLMMH